MGDRDSHRARRIAYWDSFAAGKAGRSDWGLYYHRRLGEIYRALVMPGLRVLELGCGRGDLLSLLRPSRGVGVDFSEVMLEEAGRRHPELDLVLKDVQDLDPEDAFPGETFDVVILSDLVHELWDLQDILERLKPAMTTRTRVVLNFYSRLWELPLRLAKGLGLIRQAENLNWFAPHDVVNMLHLCGYEAVRSWQEFLWPLDTPLAASFCNRVLVKLWPCRLAALTNFIVARPEAASPRRLESEPRVTVVIPARNEAGNVESAIRRTPQMGGGTELIFVEGHSSDGTYEAVEKAMEEHPGSAVRLFRQPGKGKGDAVRTGFEEATGDILMILDADLTVPPEDLPGFYRALVENRGEFINGVRLVYPMEERAMRFLNMLGNKFFSLSFSWLLGQPIKDTLCGTKVLWKEDYERIAANRSFFGDFDPFGDFDLIFGAARLNLRIVDLPIRYRERTYGATNIDRWRHGWLLIQMVVFAARKLKFV
jgi:SAM-dependent methyltransferase